MSGTFPSNLAGLKINVVKKPIWSTKVQTSVSGKELRTAWFQNPLYEFTLEIEVLRQGTINGTAYTELATIRDFYNAQLGAWDTFNYIDPDDGSVRVCRFKEDSLEFQRLVTGRWELKKCVLITVK